MSLESLLKEKLDPEDKLKKSYTARYEGKYGLLVMSKKKLLFAEEKGFMRKTYNVLLERPYTKVRESTVEKNQLVFEASGKKTQHHARRSFSHYNTKEFQRISHTGIIQVN